MKRHNSITMSEKKKIEQTPFKDIKPKELTSPDGKTYLVFVNGKQKLRFRGQDLDFDYPDFAMLERMAQTKGKLVRIKEDTKSSGSTTPAKPSK